MIASIPASSSYVNSEVHAPKDVPKNLLNRHFPSNQASQGHVGLMALVATEQGCETFQYCATSRISRSNQALETEAARGRDARPAGCHNPPEPLCRADRPATLKLCQTATVALAIDTDMLAGSAGTFLARPHSGRVFSCLRLISTNRSDRSSADRSDRGACRA